jgi:CAAX protease family protein
MPERAGQTASFLRRPLDSKVPKGVNGTPPEGDGNAEHPFSGIFLNESGLRAGWRLVLYAGLGLLLNFAGDLAVSLFIDFSNGSASILILYFQETSGFLAVYFAALLMGRLERRSPDVFGLPIRKAFGRKFCLGLLFGLCEICVLMGLISLFGGYSFGGLALRGFSLARWACVWMVFFLFVGLYEEFLFRGYTQFTLADGIGFWPAAVLLSGLFGVIHGWNPGEDWRGIAEIVFTGLVFAFVLRRTGNLWLAVGWHASFDFGETFLFSVPNSGMRFHGHLSNSFLRGPAWLSGGTVGPEASVFAFFLMGAGALVVHFLYPGISGELKTSWPREERSMN